MKSDVHTIGMPTGGKRFPRWTRRVNAVLLCLALLVGMVPLALVSAAEDERFQSFTGWELEGKGTLNMTAGVSGNGALVTKTGSGETTLVSALTAVTAGQKYRAGVSVRSAAVDAAAALRVRFYRDAAGKEPVGAADVAAATPGDTFTELANDLTAPAGASYARLEIGLGNDASVAGETYAADNAYLYPYSRTAPLYDYATTGLTPGRWYRYPDGTNSAWVNTAEYYVETVEDGYNGAGALRFVNTAAVHDMNLVLVAPKEVPAGEYTVSLWVKGTVTYTGQDVRFVDAANIDNLAYIVTKDTSKFADWTEYTYTYTSNGARDFFLKFSRYNWASDLYISHITVTNTATGVDALDGCGDFLAADNASLVTAVNLVQNGDFEDVLHNYLPLGEFNGSFAGARMEEQELGWQLFDNIDNAVSLEAATDGSHGGVLKATRHVNNEVWTTVSTKDIAVEGGMRYRFSIDMKGTGTRRHYLLSGYSFDRAGTPQAISYDMLIGAAEADLPEDWQTLSAAFTAPAGAVKVQVRIVFWGAEGDTMLLDNASLCPYKQTAVFPDEWKYGGLIMPENDDNAYIRLVEDGCSNTNAGSLHVYRNYGVYHNGGYDLRFGYCLTNVPSGNTYVLKMMVKGNFNTAGNPPNMELAWNKGTWTATGSSVYQLSNQEYADWTEVSFEFTAAISDWAPILFNVGGYNGVDCYIDNVRLYLKSDPNKTNLIPDGDFFVWGEVDTARNLIQNGSFEGLRVLTAPGWSFSGDVDYSAADGTITFGAQSSATSLRYTVESGAIYRVQIDGNGGTLRLTFDKGAEYTQTDANGYFIVPDGAQYMRASYVSESGATLKSITFRELEHPENFDFELKDPNSAMPLNWQSYVLETEDDTYTRSYQPGVGVDGSAALQVTTQKDNEKGALVIYSTRVAAKPNAVYRVTFQGKYTGKEISVYPLVRTYKASGSDTSEGTPYNWLSAANSSNGDGAWHSYTADFTTGSDTATVEMRFEVHSYVAGATFLFDNVSVRYLGDATDANLDFETGDNGEAPFNWTYYERWEKPGQPGEYEEGIRGAYTVKKVDGASGDGSAAVCVQKPDAGMVQLYLQSAMIPVEGNTNYLLSYDAMVQGNKKGSVVVCVRQFTDKLGNGTGDESVNFTWLADANAYGAFDWRNCGAMFKTAPNTKYIRIWLVPNTEEACTMYFDNVSVTPAEETNDPNLDFEYVAGGKPLNWTYATSDGVADITADSSVYYRGGHSLHIRKQYNRINYTSAEMTRRINVQAGDRIEFVVHMRSKDAVAGTFAAVVRGYGSNGTVVQDWHGQERTLHSGSYLSDWQEYRIVYTVTKNVKQVALMLRIGGKEADVYFDGVDYYNYTESGDVVYAEDFASASSDRLPGGWKMTDGQGTSAVAVANGVTLSDRAALYTDIEILRPHYSYTFTAHYQTDDTATGRLVLEGYDWRDRSVGKVVERELTASPVATEITVDFTAIDAVYYRLRLEKTGGDGGVTLLNAQLRQTGEPAESQGWEGNWIVHPADYDTIESQKNNERYYFFRQELNLEDTIKSAQLQITADDRVDVYINGEQVYTETRTGDTWSLPVTLDIGEYLHKGRNVLAMRLYNGVYRYGLLYDGIVKMDNGSALRFFSDDSAWVARASIGEDAVPNPLWTEVDEQQYMDPDYDMSTGGWTHAEIYAKAGSGGWGSIDFDNSEYSDYKLETNEFNFPKNTVYAGDTVEITATLKINEKLPKTNSFAVYFWKRNSTSRICTGTIALADGKTTDSWPVGKEFEAKFVLTVPLFLAEGSYTLQFDNTVAIVSDYFINNKVGNLKVAQPEQSVTTRSEVKLHNGKPTVFVNGIAKAPLWYSRPERDTQFDTAEMAGLANGGIDTSIAFILPRETLGELWMSDGTLKTETIDRQMLGTLAADPNSQLMVAIDTTPPQWWLDQHPDECVKLNTGVISKESFASELYRKEVGEVLTRIIQYLMEQPYANNIVGFKITGGTTYEWQWWGINGNSNVIGDYSSVGLTAFRQWLREKYSSVEALRQAWGDASVTFETAGVPDKAARTATTYGSVLSATENRHAIDYALFMGDMKTDAMLYFAEVAKKAVDNRLMVGTYAGYLLNVINYDMASSTSQTSFQRILDSEYIDFITCPWLYSEREIGYSGDYMSAVDSVTAHGKLYIAEDDDRNHTTDMFDAPDARAAVGWTRTAEQTVETLKRNYAYAISKGCGLYLYSLAGTYFTDAQVQQLASQMMQEMTLFQGLARKSVSDVAVFYDEQSAAYMGYSGSNLTDELLYKALLMYQRRELYSMGVPYDTYVLDDLEKGLVPEHKVNIMLSATQITPSERKAIEERLCKNGNVILWIFTAGLSDGETTDVANLSALTGMQMQLVSSPDGQRKQLGTVEVSDYDHWLTAGLADVSYGAIEYNTLAPVIAVNDPTARVLGYHTTQNGWAENAAGLAVKEMNENGRQWVSIYSAVPCFPQALLRNILTHLGCHVYDETASDVVYADNNYVAVHSLFGGDKTIRLPQRSTVYDVVTGKIVAQNVTEFTIRCEKSETRLFRLSSDNKLRTYFTRTAGGSITPEGLQTVDKGGSLTLTLSADKGYRLDHLMVDGVKTTVSGNTYTLADIQESHTVIACYARVYAKPPIDDGSDTTDTPNTPDTPVVPDTPTTPTRPGGDTPDTPSDDTKPTEPEKKPVKKNTVKYTRNTELNWPVILALGGGVLAGVAALVVLLLLLGRNVVFYRNGKRVKATRAKRSGIRLDGLNRRGGLTGVTAVVKRGYVRRHKGQTLRFTLDGAPKASVTLEGDGDARVTL